MKTESKEIPVIQKLQGKILIPCNIEQKTRVHEDQEEAYYQYNTLRLPINTITSLDNLKTIIKTELNSQNDAYIYSKYKAGTQQSMQAIFNSTTNAEIKQSITGIWDWIKTKVLSYYYTIKLEIDNAQDIETLLSITWNFEQFNSSKPNISLSSLV